MKKPWTDAERDQLRALYADRTAKMSDICVRMNRSKFAIINEVRRLNARRRVANVAVIGQDN